MTNGLVIEQDAEFPIDNYHLKVRSYLGQLTAGIHYFEVNFEVNLESTDPSPTTGNLALLRVGSSDGGLSRELQLREKLGNYAMIAELLASTIQDSVVINPSPPSLEPEPETQKPEEIESSEQQSPVTTDQEESEATVSEEETTDQELNSETREDTREDSSETPKDPEPESEYLEEEYYPENEISPDTSGQRLMLLTSLPDSQSTLETWLQEEHSDQESLSLIIPICQCFYYLYQRQWCLVDVIPKLIEIGKPIKFFDLTSAYPIDQKLDYGLLGNYCAFELSSGNPFQESMSSYTVGALLYQAIHQQLLPQDQTLDIQIKPIPQIYQLLKICLSSVPEERFSLSHLLSLLIETRKSFQTTQVQWQVASKSTVGLSTSRLHNEDSYGVRQQQLSNGDTMILAAVADGMGGMSQGELASQLAIKTVFEQPIPSELKTVNQQTDWLVSLFQNANQSVTNAVRNGGTTLSVILGISNNLLVAHVGDSRIYLIRKEQICQLTEDHSLVAMLLASGEITYQESLDHPDSNILTKALGSQPRLSDGYVQDLSHFSQDLSLALEDSDILLLCSDGVWSLVSDTELAETFKKTQPLQAAVDEIIQKVIDNGAYDNATILALECCIKNAS
ncbi:MULTISPECIES: protein phosphatase 2C domain-containing protein [Moorena]|uniref:Serine/threonine protein phosphatase n=1 Tax=Moorena producens 3L TaxID=489825 RepID=F4XPT2_9CYAN|nr:MULTISPECIES: protein phosphatase 2C domain-containing protein [Moorena]EGJ33400.1 serine/threonine protein phosphatase [Moorena producens 3L]NEP36312.1 serine/threonine-protein phosphatase [Moorena sp. SIO3B2]NEP66276.1 serine/threonine-protein phosphatase [Moorena sp. SIO3A5]NER88011.1 serine/threonine-protein phosphatase [Moorena sp. SIO3A2]OLT64627.1 serine/threonine protein phosphatase [Moorena producens 3L]